MLALSTLEVDEGGQLLLASAGQVYNELAILRPDLVRVLGKNWLWDEYVVGTRTIHCQETNSRLVSQTPKSYHQLKCQ